MSKKILVVVVAFVLAAGMALAQEPARPPKAPQLPKASAAPLVPDVIDLSGLEDLDLRLGEIRSKIDLDLAPMLALKLGPAMEGLTGDITAMALAGLDDEIWQVARAQRPVVVRGGDTESIEYARGTSYLDRGRYDQALQAFDKAIAANGKRRDGAMYWKAYSLNRLGRGAEALSTLDELLKKYPASRWANDARALQVEVRQASGRPVNPAQEDDEELKLLALNGLMNRDPEQALPLVEQILNGSASPRMKERALFLLAQSGSPRAKTMVTDIAKGKGNPDLQMKALDYLGVLGGGADVPLLVEIYKAAPDTEVKRRVIRSLAMAGGRRMFMPVIPPIPPVPEIAASAGLSQKDIERIQADVERARAEAERATAEAMKGAREARAASRTARSEERDKARAAKAKEASDALWQLYQAETSVELKREILRSMYFDNQSDRVIQIARTEKDAALRRSAIQALMFNRTPKTAETLVALYREEKTPEVKRQIVNVLSSMDSAGPLVQIARSETDPELRKSIVQRLSMMKDKEATDYLMEILKK
jgi:tetratricopeptide (TPR) repeat protein